LQAGQRVAHLAFEFSARHERRDRIDDHDVDRTGANQRIGNFERLLAGIGLRDQEFVDIHAKLAGINRIERVFGIHKGTDAAGLLRFGDGVERERRLAGGFRPVNLDHPTTRQAADAKRDIETERSGGHRFHVHRAVGLAQPHDRAFAECTLDLRERGIQSFRLVH
jgi:hypothetical protein